MAPPTETAPPRPWRRRLKRGALGCAVGAPVFVVLAWIAVHTFPGLGPLVGDGLRAMLGTERVSRLEDFVYGVEDRFNQWWRKDDAPKSYWEVPTASASDEAPKDAPAPDASGQPPARRPPFKPPDVGPLHKQLAAQGDGVWVPVTDPGRPDEVALMAKTLIHPDPKRPWAELFVVALDVSAIALHLVAGTAEPEATNPEGRSYTRSGLIAAEHRSPLLLAFNGGFKMTHGRWGMRVDGVTLLAARKHGCSVVKHSSGALQIHPYMATAADDALLADAAWWRQTPPCMFHEGKRHGGLWDPDSKNWGAALEGDTVIRRSAIGLDPARKILFVGVSNHTAAHVLANGMHHVGASDVAQLDVNWSFPKIVIFERDAAGTPSGKPLFEGFKVEPGEYVTEASPRDFFYVTRKSVD